MLGALCVPGCGYFGAKQRNKSLVGCFCCCNGCCMFLMTLQAAGLIGIVYLLNSTPGNLTHSFEWYINNGFADARVCCGQFDTCGWDAPPATPCNTCLMPTVDITAYSINAEQCQEAHGNHTGPAPPVERVTLDSTSLQVVTTHEQLGAAVAANETFIFCLAQAECHEIQALPAGFSVSTGMFAGVAVAMLIACIPATLGCCWGYSLYSDVHLSRPPMGYMQQAPVTTYAATTTQPTYGQQPQSSPYTQAAQAQSAGVYPGPYTGAK